MDFVNQAQLLLNITDNLLQDVLIYDIPSLDTHYFDYGSKVIVAILFWAYFIDLNELINIFNE